MPAIAPRLVSVSLFAAALSLLTAALPSRAWSATLVVPTQFPTIQAAIDQARPLDVVLVEPGTYRENLTLRSQIAVVGRETARTLLEPQSNQLPAVRIRLANDVTFSSFTLIGATTGVEVVGSVNVLITNVVFDSVREIAVDADDSDVDVANNVFFDTALAVRRDAIAVDITSNIFRSNDVTIRSRDVVIDNNVN